MGDINYLLFNSWDSRNDGLDADFLKKAKIQSLSIHDQTRVLNDLDEKFHKMAELRMQGSILRKSFNRPADQS